MDRKHIWLMGGAVTALIIIGVWPDAIPRTSGPLPQSIYVWQRAWTPGVTTAVQDRGDRFERVVILGAELQFTPDTMQVVKSNWDEDALRSLSRPPGIALRLGPYPGPFSRDDAVIDRICSEATTLLEKGRQEGVEFAELHLDFDCAEARLGGYRLWVQALRRNIAPTPVILTALPAWLDQPDFPSLIASADGTILQVHSLERPAGKASKIELCDIDATRRWVETAARIGFPFRVALPTYGYLVAFDGQDRFLGLAAEGRERSWPIDAHLREVRADAASLAGLIREWQTDRPAALEGVIWYRMPVAGDRRNWSWHTLNAVMAGMEPKALLRANPHSTEEGRLAEIEIVNEGSASASGRILVDVDWTGAEFLASDGLQGFAWSAFTDDAATLQGDLIRLDPGTKRTLGWIRFKEPAKVRCVLGEQRLDPASVKGGSTGPMGPPEFGSAGASRGATVFPRSQDSGSVQHNELDPANPRSTPANPMTEDRGTP